MPVLNISRWHLQAKLGKIDAILREPHPYTQADMEWAHKTFGMEKAQVRAHFALLPKLAYCYVGTDTEAIAYLWGVDGNGQIHTLSHARLEGYKVGMTKDVLRYMRTDDGQEFFKGAIGIAERSDATPGLIAWAGKLGFASYAERDYNGQTFMYFHKGA
jgi:hypothetical protein